MSVPRQRAGRPRAWEYAGDDTDTIFSLPKECGYHSIGQLLCSMYVSIATCIELDGCACCAECAPVSGVFGSGMYAAV